MKTYLLGLAAASASLFAANSGHAAFIIDPGAGSISVTGAGAAEFSGLDRSSGGSYLAVTDSGDTRLYQLDIQINSGTGAAVSAAAIGTPVLLNDALDTEAVRFLPNGNVLIGDERNANPPLIREYNPGDGSILSDFVIPDVYSNAQPNGGFEGMAVSPDGHTVWAINETTLANNIDGPTASPGNGEVLRLQQFNSGAAGPQWAYISDALPAGAIQTGVSELLLMDNGNLLAMERAIFYQDGVLSFETRLFELFTSGATDVSRLDALADADFTPVEKILLWQAVGNMNFESMALGPQLDNGNRSLLLLSEGESMFGPYAEPQLLGLQLAEVPLPAGVWLMASALAALWPARQRRFPMT